MKKFFIIAILLLVSQVTSFAIEDVVKVDLRSAIQTALKNNVDLQSAKLNVSIAKNDIKSANRLQNPSFEAFYFMGAAGWSEPRQLGVSQTVEIAKRRARKNLAKSNLALVEKNVNYTQFDLIMDVREAYLILLLQNQY